MEDSKCRCNSKISELRESVLVFERFFSVQYVLQMNPALLQLKWIALLSVIIVKIFPIRKVQESWWGFSGGRLKPNIRFLNRLCLPLLHKSRETFAKLKAILHIIFPKFTRASRNISKWLPCKYSSWNQIPSKKNDGCFIIKARKEDCKKKS